MTDRISTSGTITFSLKAFWAIVVGIITYSITIAGLYFTLLSRVTSNERELDRHAQAVTEMSVLKADVREIKVRMEVVPEIKSDLKDMDKKLDQLVSNGKRK